MPHVGHTWVCPFWVPSGFAARGTPGLAHMGLPGFLTGSQVGSKWGIVSGNHVGTNYDCLYGPELGSEWALSGFQLGKIYVPHVGHTCDSPLRAPSGFPAGTHVRPIQIPVQAHICKHRWHICGYDVRFLV